MQQLSQKFATQKIAQLGTSNNIAALLSTAPAAVAAPLGYTTVNTRAFDIPMYVPHFIVYLREVDFVLTELPSLIMLA